MLIREKRWRKKRGEHVDIQATHIHGDYSPAAYTLGY
jgi:5-enolpyruvylshikimate-3-phosphate synthase